MFQLTEKGLYTRLDMEYVAFSDESYHTHGIFRSIAAVSLPYSSPDQYIALSDELRCKLKCTTKGELKWKNVGSRGRNNIKRAKAIVDFVLSKLSLELRIDILIWDINDSRHSIEERDDVANYARMYFHLHRNLIRRRGKNTYWHLRPDTLSTIDWDTTQSCLKNDGTWQRSAHSEPVLFKEMREVAPYVKSFKQVNSAETPFVQLADLFAGMAAYTRSNSQVVKVLMKEEQGIQDLFANGPTCRVKNTDRARFKVISHLHQHCRRRRLGVSLTEEGYLRTLDPQNPINFWHYEPQCSQDKAPTKFRIGVNSLRSPLGNHQ